MVLGLGNSITSLYTPGETAYTASASWDFDGSGDYINLGNSWSLKGRKTNTTEGVGYSTGVWFKIDDIQTTGTTENLLSCFQYPGGWTVEYINTRLRVIFWTGDTARNVKLEFLGNWRALGTDASPLRASGWHHFGFSFDGRYLKIYLNGVQYGGTQDEGANDNWIFHDGGSGLTQGQSSADVDLHIGSDPGPLTSPDGGATWAGGTSPANVPFQGLINEVAIWNKPLDIYAFEKIFEAVNTDGAVLDLTKDDGNYNYSEGLIGLWRASDVSGTTAVDATGNNNGSIKNSLGISSEVPT